MNLIKKRALISELRKIPTTCICRIKVCKTFTVPQTEIWWRYSALD